jgi:hypothetical protein
MRCAVAFWKPVAATWKSFGGVCVRERKPPEEKSFQVP